MTPEREKFLIAEKYNSTEATLFPFTSTSNTLAFATDSNLNNTICADYQS